MKKVIAGLLVALGCVSVLHARDLSPPVADRGTASSPQAAITAAKPQGYSLKGSPQGNDSTRVIDECQDC